MSKLARNPPNPAILNKLETAYENCGCTNIPPESRGCSQVNFGHSSKLQYDCCAYNDKLAESVGPLEYRLNDNYMQNCSQCLSTLGPRSSYMGQGVSTPLGHPIATAQKVVDVESLLTNRNMKKSKCRRDQVNIVNVTEFDNKHLGICDDFLDPLSSRLSYPAQTYREIATNRFYNLNQNPQLPIFWNFAVNTSLEAKDNYLIGMHLEEPWPISKSLPKPL